MKIETIRISRLRNEEHFQFHTEFKLLVEQYTPLTLNIEEDFTNFQQEYDKEDQALDLIRRDELTKKLAEADHVRDFTYEGLFKTVEAASMHFDENIRIAAGTLLNFLEAQGNVPKKSYDEETTSLDQTDQVLTTEYAAEVTTVNLGAYQTKLKGDNTTFKNLMKERYTIDANKTPYRMKNVRTLVDKVYRDIIRRIDAIIYLNGTDGYVDFINELNERVNRYNLIIAQREGRNAKSSESAE